MIELPLTEADLAAMRESLDRWATLVLPSPDPAQRAIHAATLAAHDDGDTLLAVALRLIDGLSCSGPTGLAPLVDFLLTDPRVCAILEQIADAADPEHN